MGILEADSRGAGLECAPFVCYNSIMEELMENNKMTPPVDFQMGKVKIGGDAVKVEEPKDDDNKKSANENNGEKNATR
jgi:hypothetical protein